MIMTRNGSLMPRTLFLSAGQVMKQVETLVPMISSTELWMSWSVMRLMCPLRTSLSQICSGFELQRRHAPLTRSSTELRGNRTGMCF